jgi:hypothetical protein
MIASMARKYIPRQTEVSPASLEKLELESRDKKQRKGADLPARIGTATDVALIRFFTSVCSMVSCREMSCLLSMWDQRCLVCLCKCSVLVKVLAQYLHL